MAIGGFQGVPMAAVIAFLAVAIAYVIQERTRTGRWLYAIGTDEVTAACEETLKVKMEKAESRNE